MKNMTRKEMKAFINTCANVVKGYCSHYNAKDELKTIGTNYGVYGWNWTLYYEPTTDTAYVDGYRNY